MGSDTAVSWKSASYNRTVLKRALKTPVQVPACLDDEGKRHLEGDPAVL